MASARRKSAAEARLLGLAAWLVARGEPVTREEIYAAFPGEYVGTGAAREKKWTRDKNDLHRLGIPLIFEESEGKDGAYPLEAGSCTLPRLDFSPEEAAVLWTAGQAALRTDDPPLDRFRARHLYFQSGGERDVSVRFSGEGATLALEQWPERSTRNPDGSVTVKARLVPGNYLLGWVLGYGGQAEVAGPPDVRELLRARVAGLAAVYAG